MGDRLGIPRAVDFCSFFFSFFFFLFLFFLALLHLLSFFLSFFLSVVSFFSLSSSFDLPILCCQFFSCLFVWFLVVFQSPFSENREISFQRHFLQFSVMESGFLGLFSAFALG